MDGLIVDMEIFKKKEDNTSELYRAERHISPH